MGLLPITSGCGIFNIFNPPSTPLTIVVAPTGCGVVIDGPGSNSWTVAFTASGGAAGSSYQWFFTDGATAVGQRVVHTFDTAGKQNVDFTATVTAGSDSAAKKVNIPLLGTLDGAPDPDGDTCVTDDGHTHVPEGSDICYHHFPPASGNHYASADAPAAPGFYDEAIATGRWVHDLEHGSIVLLYDCGGTCSASLKSELQALFDSVPLDPLFGQKKMIITRFAGVPATCTSTSTFPASGPFLAIAWNVQRPFATLDTAGIIDFYNRHVDHGREPNAIPP